MKINNFKSKRAIENTQKYIRQQPFNLYCTSLSKESEKKKTRKKEEEIDIDIKEKREEEKR